MHRADKAVLRLAVGMGLSVLIAYGLALPMPFVVCVLTALLLCKPGPPLPFVKGLVVAGVVGSGVGPSKTTPPGSLPTIENSRDWLRQAQRFPVAIEFDASDSERLRKARIGGQAEVMVFTGDNLLMNMLGTVYIHLKSWLSYLY